MENEIKNAKITSTKLTMGEHGCLTFWLFVEGAGWGCGVGGYCIGHGYAGCKPDEFDATGDGLVAMMRIMDVVGVEQWEDLKGKYIRCEICRPGMRVTTIGNLIDEKWFNLSDFFSGDLKEKRS